MTTQKIEAVDAAQVPPEKSLFETLLEGMERDIPAEEWEKLPVDGAENHDYYLYGAPKKSDLGWKEAA